SGCMDGVEAVIAEQRTSVSKLLLNAWESRTDASVFLPLGATAAARDPARDRLEGIDGVTRVTWESPEQAYRRLPPKLRRDGRDPAKTTPPLSPGSMRC